MYLTTLDFAVIIVYLAGLSLVGLYFSRRQTSRREYFLAGRSVHWALAAGSILATLLSTITYLNFPGEMIRYGIAYFSGLLILPLIPPLLNRFWLPVLMKASITSVYEYLERRYDAKVRTLAASAFVMRSLIWMALIVYTASFAIAEVTGWTITTVILLMGVITTFYTATGGFRTVIWTDNLQLALLFGGGILIPAVVWYSIGAGPPAWWGVFSQAGRAETPIFSADLTVRSTIVAAMLSIFFWEVCTQGADQVAVQRYLATAGDNEARRTIWMYMCGRLTLNGLLIVCGLALFAFYFHRSGQSVGVFQDSIATRADRAMLEFIVHELPAGISGLLVAALLAAAMSSVSSGINSMSSIVVTDFLGRSEKFDEGWQVWAAKIVAASGGLIAVLGGLGLAAAKERTDWNLFELTHRINHIFVGPLAVLFFAGIFFRRAGRPAALFGFLFGTLVSLYVCFGREWFGLEKSISFLWVIPGSFVSGLLGAAVWTFLLPVAGSSPAESADQSGEA